MTQAIEQSKFTRIKIGHSQEIKKKKIDNTITRVKQHSCKTSHLYADKVTNGAENPTTCDFFYHQMRFFLLRGIQSHLGTVIIIPKSTPSTDRNNNYQMLAMKYNNSRKIITVEK